MSLKQTLKALRKPGVIPSLVVAVCAPAAFVLAIIIVLKGS